MSGDLIIRTEGRAGRITLNRPKALNALTHDMSLRIERALDAWAGQDDIALVIVDAAGDKAFCAGGDIALIHAQGSAGELDKPRGFWRDEYRLNAKIAAYPKPVVAFMQGFVMGGGVGLGCHATHRIVAESTRVAMPECGIGLVPDVGGSLLLAGAPGRTGEYLGLTGARMDPGDAILAGFADHFVPAAAWPDLCAALCETAETDRIDQVAMPPPNGALARDQAAIETHFQHETLPRIIASLRDDPQEVAQGALKAISRGSPLSMACTLRMVRAMRAGGDIRAALQQEYRFTHRSMDQGDLLEGIRAQIIDKDRNPRWKHSAESLTDDEVAAMLAPLGAAELELEGEART